MFNFGILAFAQSWSYDENAPNGPQFWGKVSPNCDGKRQSPINLVWGAATPVIIAAPIVIHEIDRRPASIRYHNDGHGVAITFNYAGAQPRITGGPLRTPYIFHSMHLHWRSEHIVNGVQNEAELHLVHYNSKYGSLSQAVEHADGLAVLGFLYFVR